MLPKLRRKLLFHASMATDVTKAFADMKSKLKKRSFSECIHFKYVKKYSFSKTAKPYV